MENNFKEIAQLIKDARNNALKTVNTELINLYWNVGLYISIKIKKAEWGDKTVSELADYLQMNHSELKGFTRTALHRMVKFYEIYHDTVIVASLRQQLQSFKNQEDTIVAAVRQQFESQDIRDSILAKISWTHHRTIFSRCNTDEERMFYLKLSIRENYSVRELDRQISASLFERAMTSENPKSIIPKNSKTDIQNVFKDSYVFDFLNLPEQHSEGDLQKGLIDRMKDFILELGRDFIFIDSEYKLMVGDSDFYIDLLFYHRALQCLVAFELKAGKFKPEHNGKRIAMNNIGKDKSEPARKEIEQSFNLVKAEDHKNIFYRPEPVSAKVQYGKVETKKAIESILTNVINNYRYTSLQELNAILKLYNITADKGTENSRLARHKGLLYHALDTNEIRLVCRLRPLGYIVTQL